MSLPLKVLGATAPKVMSTKVMFAFKQVYCGILFAPLMEMLNTILAVFGKQCDQKDALKTPMK